MRNELLVRAGKVVLHCFVNKCGVPTGKRVNDVVVRMEHDRNLAAPPGADDADEGE